MGSLPCTEVRGSKEPFANQEQAKEGTEGEEKSHKHQAIVYLEQFVHCGSSQKKTGISWVAWREGYMRS